MSVPADASPSPSSEPASDRLELSDLRDAQRVAQLGSWAVEVATGRRYRSPEYLRLFALEPDQAHDVELAYLRLHPEDRDRARAALERLVETGEPLDETYRLALPDGSARVIHARGRRETLPGGRVRAVGTVQDVTEEQRLRDQLSKTSAALDAVLAHSPTAIFVKDREQRFLLANAETARIMGRPGEDLVGRSLWDLLPHDIAAALEANDAEVAARDVAVSYEETAPHAGDGGREHTWLASKFPVRDEHGALIGVGGISLDVTGRQAAEREVARLAAIVESSHDAIVGKTLDGTITNWNPAAERMYGYTAAEAIGQPIAMLLTGPEQDADLAALLDTVAEGDRHERVERRRTKDGRIIEVSLAVSPILDADGRVVGASTIGHDVTERNRAQQVLREAEARFRVAFEEAPIGMALVAPDGAFLRVNRALCAMLGHDEAALLAGAFQALTHPDDLAADLEHVRATLAGEQAGYRMEKRYVHRTGRTVWATLSVSLVRDADGAPLYFVSQVEDVTAAKLAQAELLEQRRALADSEARLRAFVEHSPAAIVLRDLAGNYEYVNAEAATALGVPADELVGRSSYDSHPPQVAAVLRAEDARIAADGTRTTLRAPVRHPDGSDRLYEVTKYPVLDGDGRLVGFGSFSLDVTERAQHDAEEVALRHIAELVAQPAGPAAIFDAVATQVLALFGGHSGAVVRFDLTREVGVFVTGRTHDGTSLAGAEVSLTGSSAPASVFRTGAAARTGGAPSVGVDRTIAAFAGELSDAVAAPIVVAGRRWGCLAAAFTGRPAPRDAEARLGRFAELVGMAVANAEAWETLSRQASTDAVTGLANHRTFQRRLRAEVTRARRYHRSLSVVLFDLDHFKQVNDTHGHQAGDSVLAEVGRRLAAEAREGELLARIGGEEFAWLLPETEQHAAYQAAERVRRAIEDEPFAHVGTVTVSAGTCTLGEGADAEDLVRFADRALYWAKDGGRNTTFVYTDEAHALLAADARQVEKFQAVSSVRALARAIDSKDSSTSQHSERVAELAERIAVQLGWTAKRARLLHACGLLHDVGKIGIPDEILLKPGPLTPAEYTEIKRHAEISARIAAEVLEGEQVSWIRGHHERWDGTGYPDALAGDEIPDGAQILALADAFDVMTQSRIYQRRRTVPEALDEVRVHAGRQFAPAAVAALLAVLDAAASSAGTA